MAGMVRRRATLEELLERQLQEPLVQPSGANWIPELPQPFDAHMDLLSRMPEPDFVPETVTDPGMREKFRQQIRDRQARESANRVRSNQWGNQVPGLLPGQTATLIHWIADDDKPLAVNVQLSYTIDQPLPGPPESQDISIYAKVEWGGGGANQLAYVDFGGGTQLRLTGSYVRVSATYLPNNLPSGWPPQPAQALLAVAAGPTGPPVTVSAILGEGHPTFLTSAARFTRTFRLVASARTLALDPIPPFAQGVGLVANGADDFNMTISFAFNNSGGPEGTVSIPFVTTSSMVPDPGFSIPQGAKFISVTNNSVHVPSMNVALIYALML